MVIEELQVQPFDQSELDELDLTARFIIARAWPWFLLFRSRQHGRIYRVPRNSIDGMPTQQKKRKFMEEHDAYILGARYLVNAATYMSPGAFDSALLTLR